MCRDLVPYGVGDILRRGAYSPDGLVGGAFELLLAGADDHAYHSTGYHADADPAHKMIVFHGNHPIVLYPEIWKNTLLNNASFDIM